MTQLLGMRRFWVLATAACAIPVMEAQGTQSEPVAVSTDHPRLLLPPARLRLLKRERERSSTRWQQLQLLMTGNAPMPERGFSLALYYKVSGDANYGHKAIDWALGPGNDLRQLALVYDWCQDLLTPAQNRALAARLEKGMAAAAANDSVASIRSRAFAAVALFDHVPDSPQRELQRVVRTWWEGKIVPALKSGKAVIMREDAYALMELLHAIRDSTIIELRESIPRFFKDYPIEHLLSYYPAAYPAPENDYYIGATRDTREPDLQAAALSRAAEFAMVAYDLNAAESQVLQGWLMHDRYMMRSTFGAPYEFLWANPYQPGLSYTLVPLVYHNADFGKLFVRSSWEEGARWFGYFDGVMQIFENGQRGFVNAQRVKEPMQLKEALICFAQSTQKFRLKLDEEQAVFILGLQPRRTYDVEIDDQEMVEMDTDPGGILVFPDLPHGKEVGLRLHEAPRP
jgi:hypothetical protein